MEREECIQKIRHIQRSMYTFLFEDRKLHQFKADDADKFYYYLDMIVKYLDEDVSKEKEPKIGHCKDCKWWKDSNGAFRRGIGAESICRINTDKVYQGDGYCYLFEPQETETWNGIHTQITAPKGTFERLFNEAEDDNDI